MRRTVIIAIAVLSVCTLVLTHGISAGPARHPVKGWGSTEQPLTMEYPPPPFEGSGVLSIRGQEHKVSITTVLLGTPRISDDGVMQATSSHTFTFANGDTIITHDKSRLTPTENPLVLLLNGNLEIVDGTAGVMGRLTAQGTLTVAPEAGVQTTDFKIQGTISDYDHQAE